MNEEIESIEQLRNTLSNSIGAELAEVVVDLAVKEFHRGVRWERTKNYPTQILKGISEEGDGRYHRTVDDLQYRIILDGGIPTVYKSKRTAQGYAVVSGWFGRIIGGVRAEGRRPTERTTNRIFLALTKYTRYLKEL